MPTTEQARGRTRLVLVAPFIPLILLLVAMGATDVLARRPDGPPGERFRAAPAEANAAMGLVPSEACGGALTASGVADARGRADEVALGCTHGLDVYTPDATVNAVAASYDSLPPVPTPPGIPCYRSGPYVKVLYVYDRNRSSKLTTRRPLIREIVAHADKLIDDSARDGSARRHVRWLMDGKCKVRVTAVPANLGLDVISLRMNLMSRGYLSGSQKGLAFTEGGSPYGSCSGIAEVYPDDRASTSRNRNNGGGMLALVYAGCWTQGQGVMMGTEVATHELLHTLGAVQLSAPNSTSQFHCTDESDVMCYEDGSGEPLRDVCVPKVPERLDCRKNDYFNPKPKAGSYLDKHWNTARSAYLNKYAPSKWDKLARPTVSVTGPSGGIAIGVATFTANVSAPSGSTIKEVAWEVNGRQVGSDTSAPFTLKLNTLPDGFGGGYSNGQTLTVVAHAADNYFRWKTSTPRKATVDNPRIRLLSPTAYDVASGDMPWSAEATASAGRTIVKVDLLVNGSVVATDTSAPFGGTWNARPYAGAVEVVARLMDSGGTVRSTEPRSVPVGAPTIELLAPSPWAHGEWGVPRVIDGSILLAAVPTPVYGSGIAEVRFRVNGAVVGTDTSAPYTHLYSTAGLSNEAVLTFDARVVDDRGHIVTSEQAFGTVQNSPDGVTLTAPTSGATLSGDVTLSASITIGAGRTISYVAYLVDGQEVASAWESPWSATWASGDGWIAAGAHVVSVRVDYYDDGTFDSFSVESAGTPVTLLGSGPSVSVTAPGNGSTVSGNVTLGASVTGGMGNDYVEFFAGGQWIGWCEAASTSCSTSWDSTASHDATVAVRAVVNGTWSAPRTVTVANTKVALTGPANGATVSGTVQITASASVDSEAVIEWVRFFVDGALVGKDRTSGYAIGWKTVNVANGSHTLKAVLVTSDGRSITSATRTVTVAN